jgi:2-polyprenyl-6-methoxyphenol hydroxylase-like FAD-dependent oxidoreductase
MKVIINGAGLGGLSLAQGLKRANIDFRVFERDPTKDSRLQGYRLRINPEGSDALKKLLHSDLWTVFQRSSATTVFGITRVDVVTGEIKKQGPAIGHRGPPPVGNPDEVYTADRSTLRATLLIGIEDHVECGKEFVRYEKIENGVKAYYAGGHVEE